MTKKIVPAIALYSSLIAAAYGIETKYWEYSKIVDLGGSPNKIMAAPLDKEVLNATKPGFEDLRLLDSAGGLAPYAIFTQSEESKVKNLKVNVLMSEIQLTESVMEAEIINYPVIKYNSMTIVPKGSNFFRKITVEGSDDRTNWSIIRKDMPVYSMHLTRQSRYVEYFTNEIYGGVCFEEYSGKNLEITFPEVNFKYIKLRVPHDLDKDPVEIENIEVAYSIKISASETEYQGRILKMLPDDKLRSVDIIVDFGVKNAHITEIELVTNDVNFFRNLKVEASDDIDKWEGANAGSGAIFSLNVDDYTERDMKVKINRADKRYYKIKILNGDNRPIFISSVKAKALTRFFVFIPEKGKTYKLLYGNPKADKVNYDIQRIIDGKQLSDFDLGKLGHQLRNEKYIPFKESKPWTEEYPYFLWVVLGVIMAGLILLGAQVLKKVGK